MNYLQSFWPLLLLLPLAAAAVVLSELLRIKRQQLSLILSASVRYHRKSLPSNPEEKLLKAMLSVNRESIKSTTIRLDALAQSVLNASQMLEKMAARLKRLFSKRTRWIVSPSVAIPNPPLLTRKLRRRKRLNLRPNLLYSRLF